MTPPDTIVVPLTHRNQVAGGRGGTIEVPVTVPTYVIFTEVQAFAEAWRRNAPGPASSVASRSSAAAVDATENGAPGPDVAVPQYGQRPEHRLLVDAPAPQSTREERRQGRSSVTTAAR